MRLRDFAGAVVLCLAATAAIRAESPGTADLNDPDRREAFQLYRQHKMPEAAALLEKVVARYPADMHAHEALGAALVSRAATESDSAKAKADLLFARRELLLAQELGDNSDLCRTLLSEIPEDGAQAPRSTRPEVGAALQEGEAAFAQADWPRAITAYSRAWQLDSSQPKAALYLGDTYFRLKDFDQAGEWFAKAIQADPNQETAYRYWGDALLAQNKMKEARAKYIEGVAADPYQVASLTGVRNWLSKNNLKWKELPIALPRAPKAGDTVTVISVDSALPNENARAAWLAYSMERSLWPRDKFSKEFPEEKSYRHSLKEETAALTATVDIYRELSSQEPTKQDASLDLLSKLSDEGMLEPFVLLTHADAQLAQDFPSYRTTHRDKLIGYLDAYVVPPAP